MKITNEMWDFFQQHLGYSDEEMKQFRENPRNEDVLSKAVELMNKTIIAEVIESNGCNSQHKVGDRIYFDGAGNLISKLCPSLVCAYAIAAATPLVFTANELLYAGTDPNEMRFKRVGCFDVGVKCGGWGRVIMELKVEGRK